MTLNSNVSIDELSSQSKVTMIWVDQNIGEAGTHLALKQKFQALSSLIKKWHYFVSSDDFESYLIENQMKNIICIMSGSISRQLVPKYSHSNKIHSIYVFCFDVELAKRSLANETKIAGILDLEEELYGNIADGLAKLFTNQGIESFDADNRVLARIYYQEAKRLLNTQANYLNSYDKMKRLKEIDDRLEQLFA